MLWPVKDEKSNLNKDTGILKCSDCDFKISEKKMTEIVESYNQKDVPRSQENKGISDEEYLRS